MCKDIDKLEMLRELGVGSHEEHILGLMEDAGLSRRSKGRISVEKIPEVEALLSAMVVIRCNRGDCKHAAARQANGRLEVVAAETSDCDICEGSATARYVAQAVSDCKRRGWRRLCLVGGSPKSRLELENSLGSQLELRLIDGTVNRNLDDAAPDLQWADAVFIWATTQLAHSVSNLYMDHPHVYSVPRRGVLKLCKGISRACGRSAE